MKQSPPSPYLNITKKELTKKYLRNTFTYQKLLQEAQNSFGISSRNYYAVSYYKQPGMLQYLRTKGQFQHFLTEEGTDQLFIDKHEGGADALQESGKDSNKTSEYNQSIAKALEQIKSKHYQQVKSLQQEALEQLNQKIMEKQSQLRSKIERRMKSSLEEWRESCSECKRLIKGVKYVCASCEFWVCEVCERDNVPHQFSGSHTLIKIKDKDKQIRKKYLKDKNQKRSLVSQKQKPSLDTIKTLIEVASMPRDSAIDLVKKHPNKDANQLLNMILQK